MFGPEAGPEAAPHTSSAICACARSGPVSKFVREHAFCAPTAAGSRERARVAAGGSGLNSQLGALVLEEDAAQMDMTLGVQTECLCDLPDLGGGQREELWHGSDWSDERIFDLEDQRKHSQEQRRHGEYGPHAEI